MTRQGHHPEAAKHHRSLDVVRLMAPSSRNSLFVALVLATVGCAPVATSPPTGSQSAFGTAAPSPVGASAPVPTSASVGATATVRTHVGEWQSVAPMHRPRNGFDAVVLAGGTVLAVGDDHSCQPGGAVPGSETAEVYDPGKDVWNVVDSLNKPRKTPATVVLPDGSALVIGGLNADEVGFSSTKRFDPTTTTWADGPLLNLARSVPLAATLGDGRILVVSRDPNTADRSTSEILEPGKSAWAAGPAFPAHTDIVDLVAFGESGAFAVGFFGGDSDPVSVAYRLDPTRDAWVKTDVPPGLGYDLVALPDGGILAIGGSDGGDLMGGTGALTGAVSRFDPAIGLWAKGAPMASPRSGVQIVALSDGRVLVAGGTADDPNESHGTTLGTTEIYDPTADRWATSSDLLTPRMEGQAIRLADGSVLILGGYDAFNTEGDTPFCPPPLTSVERFYPGS